MTRTAENILKSISWENLMNRIPNHEIRQEHNIADIAKYTKTRKKAWNNYTLRAEEARLIPKSRKVPKPGVFQNDRRNVELTAE